MLDGEDITYQKEHVRSKVIGHLFQDPLKGTAPHMTIEENMALAYLRTTTSKNAYFSRIKAADKKKFREQLALLDMGLEDRMKAAGRTFVRWTASGTHTFDGNDGDS